MARLINLADHGVSEAERRRSMCIYRIARGANCSTRLTPTSCSCLPPCFIGDIRFEPHPGWPCLCCGQRVARRWRHAASKTLYSLRAGSRPETHQSRSRTLQMASDASTLFQGSSHGVASSLIQYDNTQPTPRHNVPDIATLFAAARRYLARFFLGGRPIFRQMEDAIISDAAPNTDTQYDAW